MAGRRLTTPGAATTWLPTARPVDPPHEEGPAVYRIVRLLPILAVALAGVLGFAGFAATAAEPLVKAQPPTAIPRPAPQHVDTTECTPVNNDGYQVCSRDKGS